MNYFNYMSVIPNSFDAEFQFTSQDNYTILSKRYRKRFTHYKATLPNGKIHEMQYLMHPMRVCKELQKVLNSPVTDSIVMGKDVFVKARGLFKIDKVVIPNPVELCFENGQMVTLEAVYYS